MTARSSQEEVWSLATADTQDDQTLYNGASNDRQLPTSMSDVQMVEAFFDLERRLDTAVAEASHPSFTPEVYSSLCILHHGCVMFSACC